MCTSRIIQFYIDINIHSYQKTRADEYRDYKTGLNTCEHFLISNE